MVAVRSNKEMVKNSSLDTNRPIQVTDWAIENVVSSLHCMNDPQPEGSHGKPHRTTKILSHARWCGGCVAARGARAAANKAGADWISAIQLPARRQSGQLH